MKLKCPLIALSESYTRAHSYRKTAREFHLPLSSTFRLLNKSSSIKNSKKRGRPNLITERLGRQIIRHIKKTPNIKPKQIISDLKLGISYYTLRRYLIFKGFVPKKLVKKPFIKNITKQNRMEYCCTMIHQPKLLDMLVFTDEKRFSLDNLFSNDKIWVDTTSKIFNDVTNNDTGISGIVGNVKYMQKNYEKATIMVWGAISTKGVLHLEQCEKTIDSTEYINIVREKFLPRAETFYNNKEFFIVQDKAPCHVSKKTKKAFTKMGIDVINLSPNSPDLNPIENIWGSWLLEFIKEELDTKTRRNYGIRS
eukprot:GAHX01000481.1.p1 GENE.GAHX01000481.1~~GAHX01000481.1.p1  ORF type:complete len:320 (+),score=35.28 GAHX01000481.1:36-962(+)